MIIYVFIFFLLIILSKLFSKKYTNNICFIILFIFSAIRFDVGWDFQWYYLLATKFEYFKYSIFIAKSKILLEMNQGWEKELGVYFTIEPLNKILYKVSWFFESPQLLITLYSFLTLFFIKKGLDYKKKKDYEIWLFFYSFPLFYFHSLNTIRQWLAISIVFFSYKYIENKKILKFVLCVLVAGLFHKTALLVGILYFISWLNIKKEILVFLFFISFFSKDFLEKLLLLDLPIISKYKIYVLTSLGEGGRIIYFLIILLYLGILIITYLDKKFYEQNKNAITYTCFGCFIYVALIDLGHLGPRMSEYFIVFILYFLDDAERVVKNKFKIKKYIFILVELLFLVLLLYGDKNNIVRSQWVPYEVFFLNKDKTFHKIIKQGEK
ncbi:EpsG family protein [Fusobacterium varium]